MGFCRSFGPPLQMGITTECFHSRGTCWRFCDLLNRVVRGPKIPRPVPFSDWYGISSGPDDLLAGRDRRALLTSDAQMLSKVNTEDRMEGQTGKASWLREAFELINLSFSNPLFCCQNQLSSAMMQEEVAYRRVVFPSGRRAFQQPATKWRVSSSDQQVGSLLGGSRAI